MADTIYLEMMDKTHPNYQMVVDDIHDVIFYKEHTEFIYGFGRGIAGRWYAVDRWGKGTQVNWNMGDPEPVIDLIKADLEFFRNGELPPTLPENNWMSTGGPATEHLILKNGTYEIVSNLEQIINAIESSTIPKENRQLFCCWW